jgi:hypothetical protein
MLEVEIEDRAHSAYCQDMSGLLTMTPSGCNVLLLLSLVFLALVQGFQSPTFSRRCTADVFSFSFPSARCVCRPVRTTTPLAVGNSPGDSNDAQDVQRSAIPTNFNPFSYQTSGKSSGNMNLQQSYNTNYSTRISLRKTKMQDLNQQLLNTATEADLQELLESNKEFILEPLDEDDAVLEEDSIYSSTMNRSERYQAYRRAMEERLESCKNSQVKQVLSALKDFVLSHE